MHADSTRTGKRLCLPVLNRSMHGTSASCCLINVCVDRALTRSVAVICKSVDPVSSLVSKRVDRPSSPVSSTVSNSVDRLTGAVSMCIDRVSIQYKVCL